MKSDAFIEANLHNAVSKLLFIQMANNGATISWNSSQGMIMKKFLLSAEDDNHLRITSLLVTSPVLNFVLSEVEKLFTFYISIKKIIPMQNGSST